LRYEGMTGLDGEQLPVLTVRVHAPLGGFAGCPSPRSRGGGTCCARSSNQRWPSSCPPRPRSRARRRCEPVPGAWHDAHAFAASGLADRLADSDVCGCPGLPRIGTDHRHPQTGRSRVARRPPTGRPGAQSVPRPRRARRTHHRPPEELEILSHRYRGPLDKLGKVIRAVVALHFFRYT
jgi:hypothetical protein